jgi:hypothetical protein
VAVFKAIWAGVQVKINNVDHEPPHCHVWPDGKNTLVDLRTLEVLRPRGVELPAPLYQQLRKHQAELLETWQKVTVMDPRKCEEDTANDDD